MSKIIKDCKYEIEFQNLLLDNSNYFLPRYALQRPAVKTMINGNLYEPMTHKLVEKISHMKLGSIVHAGAFYGDMLPSFSKKVNGVVYAFEPVLENYILAKLTVESNNLQNVVLLNSALSDVITNLKINTKHSENLHAGGSSKISNYGQMCTSFAIDNLNAQDILLIHLDIEGHELMALQGGVITIKRCKPVIALEDNKKNCNSFLVNLNYEFCKKIPGLNIWI